MICVAMVLCATRAHYSFGAVIFDQSETRG